MEDGRAIANAIISRPDASTLDLTNIKLNKLIYFAHGWYLARKGKPLIKNHIEAWQYGPVVRVVYEAFRRFGCSHITEKAEFFCHKRNAFLPVEINDQLGFDHLFFHKIIDYYSKYTAIELIKMTHKNGSPWDIIFNNADLPRGIRDRIPNEIIHMHFSILSGNGRPH